MTAKGVFRESVSEESLHLFFQEREEMPRFFGDAQNDRLARLDYKFQRCVVAFKGLFNALFLDRRL